MQKRIISLFLALIMTVSCLSAAFSATAANENTVSLLTEIYKKFPTGKYWNHMGSSANNPDGVTNTPCASHSGCSWTPGACSCNSFDNSIQCMGFAHKIAYEITGKSPRNYFTKIEEFKLEDLRVGDVIRMRGNRHSVCVVGVDYENEKVAIAHANWGNMCGIIWTVWDASYIQTAGGGYSYTLHLDGNDRKNNDLDFYESIEIPEDEESEEKIVDCNEVWKMADDANLNVRNNYSTSALIVGSIPMGEKFTVTKKYDDGTYLWGNVTYGNITGWSALNYATCISTDTPNVNVESITLARKSVAVYAGYSYTMSATVSPSDATNKVLKWTSGDSSVATVSSSGKITGKKIGMTTVTCAATDGSGVKVSFKVYVYPGKVTLTQDVASTTANKVVFTWDKLVNCDSYNVYKYNGSTKKYEYIKNTASATYTDSSVKAGRNYAYIVKGVAKVNNVTVYGPSVKITCTSDPAAVTGIKQTYSTSSSVTLSWNKVTNASYYVVYMYNKTKADYDRMGETTSTSFVCRMDSANATRFLVYAVTKTDAGYFNSASSAAVLGISGPEAPTLKVQTGIKCAKLTWNKVTSATRYDIYRLVGSKYVRIASVSATSNTYTDKNLVTGSNYYYKVRAINSKYTPVGYGSYSATAKVTVK